MTTRASFLVLTAAIAGTAVLATPASAQTELVRWNFTSTIAAPYNTPAATSGVYKSSALLTSLDMDSETNANGTNTAATCDVLSTTGNPDANSSQFTWRVRGDKNGWALAAPQFKQGIQLNTSTVGYQNIVFNFDWYCTTQGIRDLQVQYNTNINNANGWVNYVGNFGGTVATEVGASGNKLLVATSNNYNTNANTTTNMIDFAANGITNIGNNANFGIRLVSAYDPATGNYSSAAGGVYNNNSGNWRFDQLRVTGSPSLSAAPEASPALLVVLGLGGIALIRLRRSLKSAK